MQRLMYLSVSILCLSLSLMIGFHLGVRSAEADFEMGGVVIAGQDPFVLLADGTMWQVEGTEFIAKPGYDVPTALLPEIKFWSPGYFVTTQDDVYASDGSGTWTNLGNPGAISSVNVEPTTWGKLKSQYKDN